LEENMTAMREVTGENLKYTYPSGGSGQKVTPIVPIDVVLGEGSTLPEYKTSGAAGMDLFSKEDVTLVMGNPTLVKTGVFMAIPEGYEGQVRPRSGLALKGITVLNTPGTIDSDYRGEIGVILVKLTGAGPLDTYEIKKGDRIAQLVINKVERALLDPKLFLETTDRGAGGFGSTGK